MPCESTSGKILLGQCCGGPASLLQMSVVVVNIRYGFWPFSTDNPPTFINQNWAYAEQWLIDAQFPEFGAFGSPDGSKWQGYRTSVLTQGARISSGDLSAFGSGNCRSIPGGATIDRAYPANGFMYYDGQDFYSTCLVKVKYRFDQSASKSWEEEKFEFDSIGSAPAFPQSGCNNLGASGWASSGEFTGETGSAGQAEGVDLAFNHPVLSTSEKSAMVSRVLSTGSLPVDERIRLVGWRRNIGTLAAPDTAP